MNHLLTYSILIRVKSRDASASKKILQIFRDIDDVMDFARTHSKLPNQPIVQWNKYDKRLFGNTFHNRGFMSSLKVICVTGVLLKE